MTIMAFHILTLWCVCHYDIRDDDGFPVRGGYVWKGI